MSFDDFAGESITEQLCCLTTDQQVNGMMDSLAVYHENNGQYSYELSLEVGESYVKLGTNTGVSYKCKTNDNLSFIHIYTIQSIVNDIRTP